VITWIEPVLCIKLGSIGVDRALTLDVSMLSKIVIILLLIL